LSDRPVHAGAACPRRRSARLQGAAARVDPDDRRRRRDRDLGRHTVTRIAIALFEGAEELDWAGPWEVLAAWSRQWPDDGVEVFTVADAVRPIACAKGLRVLPDHTWDDAPPPDVVVWPGGMGTRAQLGDESGREG